MTHLDRIIQLENMADTMKKEAARLRREMEQEERKKKPKNIELEKQIDAALLKSLTRRKTFKTR